MAKRGRPMLPESERRKVKNVTLDADLVQSLNSIADELQKQMGFRPTLSQAVRYLIKMAKEA